MCVYHKSSYLLHVKIEFSVFSTMFSKDARLMISSVLQGHLADKKTSTPWEYRRTLCKGLQLGPRGLRFLISEVPL